MLQVLLWFSSMWNQLAGAKKLCSLCQQIALTTGWRKDKWRTGFTEWLLKNNLAAFISNEDLVQGSNSYYSTMLLLFHFSSIFSTAHWNLCRSLKSLHVLGEIGMAGRHAPFWWSSSHSSSSPSMNTKNHGKSDFSCRICFNKASQVVTYCTDRSMSKWFGGWSPKFWVIIAGKQSLIQSRCPCKRDIPMFHCICRCLLLKSFKACLLTIEPDFLVAKDHILYALTTEYVVTLLMQIFFMLKVLQVSAERNFWIFVFPPCSLWHHVSLRLLKQLELSWTVSDCAPAICRNTPAQASSSISLQGLIFFFSPNFMVLVAEF